MYQLRKVDVIRLPIQNTAMSGHRFRHRLVSKCSLERLERRLCLTALSFLPHNLVDPPKVNGASYVYAADLDDDGDLDMLSASMSDGKTAWYPNVDGRGTFGEQRVIFEEQSDDESSRFAPGSIVYASDIDGDGDLDVVSNTYPEGRVSWFENLDGKGTFGPPVVIDTQENSRLSMTADIDNDGDQDVVTTSGWYENLDSAGSFSTRRNDVGDISIFAADLDGDGDLDLVSGGVTIYTLENTDGNGTFGPRVDTGTSVNVAVAVYAADFDGDGDMDVVSSGALHSTFWLENAGDGTFANQHEITAYEASSLFAVDLDGDEDIDILTPHGWHENKDGRGNFGRMNRLDLGWGVYAADVDSDGDMDIMAASYSSDTIAWFENTDGYGDFVLKQTVVSAEVSEASGVEIVDLDNDGDLDVLSAAREDETSWFENLDGKGTFGVRRTVGLGVGERASAHDFDGDGDFDVLVMVTAGSLRWFENVGNGQNFVRRDRIAVHSNEALVGDFDGDGDLDIASGFFDFGSSEIYWLENTDGLGNFERKQTITESSQRERRVLDAVDLDSDGDLDLLSARTDFPYDIEWFENMDGLGTFADRQFIIGLGFSALFVVAHDIDGDGDPDILAATEGGRGIVWFENRDGQGRIVQHRQNLATDVRAKWLDTIDFDGDGDLDVIASSYSDGKVVWFENVDGQGNFGPKQTISATSPKSLSVDAGDIDGDGDIDVVASSSQLDQITWFENRLTGDANNDGVFNSNDLVQVFKAGEYEDNILENSTFDEGDWNGDGDFESSDLVHAFQAGNYVFAAVLDYDVGEVWKPLSQLGFESSNEHEFKRGRNEFGQHRDFAPAINRKW